MLKKPQLSDIMLNILTRSYSIPLPYCHVLSKETLCILIETQFLKNFFLCCQFRNQPQNAIIQIRRHFTTIFDQWMGLNNTIQDLENVRPLQRFMKLAFPSCINVLQCHLMVLLLVSKTTSNGLLSSIHGLVNITHRGFLSPSTIQRTLTIGPVNLKA